MMELIFLLLFAQKPDPAPMPPVQPLITIPTEVTGYTGQGTFLTVKTACKDVRFVAWSEGLWVIPYGQLANKTATWVTAQTPGEYFLACYGATPAGELTDLYRVKVTIKAPGPVPPPGPNPGPGPSPNPNPPQPGPVPPPDQDPLLQAFQSALGGLQEANQKPNLAKLAKAWEAAPNLLAESKTVGDWTSKVRKSVGLPVGVLLAVRQRVTDEVIDQLGERPETPLTPELATKAATLSKRLAGIFNKLAE
jgi:hypothetical protein